MNELIESIPDNVLPTSSAVSAEGNASSSDWPSELDRVAAEVRTTSVPPRATVRTLLSWFAAQRRGSFIVWLIRRHLEKLDIKTEPDFNSVWIDAEVAFVPATANENEAKDGVREEATSVSPESTAAALEMDLPTQQAAFVGGAIEDPTYRIGKLDAANKPVMSVTPNHTIKQAATLMLMHGFSQLPVMQSDRDVKGILTWENIGTRLSLGKECNEARECMTPAQIISSDKSLFAAIDAITQYEYVLIQAADKRITGIVTASDLSLQFQRLTEPFLLLSEIEQHIRRMIVHKFTTEELRTVCDPNDQEREIHNVADLTMGEYIRLLENPENWDRLKLRIDRGIFIDELKLVKRIRNDIMHFDPDPLGENDLQLLRRFVIFMQSMHNFA